MNRQPEHLGKIAHRGLPAVALPVRVGIEADCGVESQVWFNRPQVLGIKGKYRLETLQGI